MQVCQSCQTPPASPVFYNDPQNLSIEVQRPSVPITTPQTHNSIFSVTPSENNNDIKEGSIFINTRHYSGHRSSLQFLDLYDGSWTDDPSTTKPPQIKKSRSSSDFSFVSLSNLFGISESTLSERTQLSTSIPDHQLYSPPSEALVKIPLPSLSPDAIWSSNGCLRSTSVINLADAARPPLLTPPSQSPQCRRSASHENLREITDKIIMQATRTSVGKLRRRISSNFLLNYQNENSTYTSRLFTAFQQWKHDMGSTLCAYMHNMMNWTGLDGDEFQLNHFDPHYSKIVLFGREFSIKVDKSSENTFIRHRNTLKELGRFIDSLILMTYRRDFAPMYRLLRYQQISRHQQHILKITSDAGWGCMVRCSQMLLYQGLKKFCINTIWNVKKTDIQNVMDDISLFSSSSDHEISSSCGEEENRFKQKKSIYHSMEKKKSTLRLQLDQLKYQLSRDFYEQSLPQSIENYLLELFLDIPQPHMKHPFSIYSFVRSAGGGLGWAYDLYGSLPIESQLLKSVIAHHKSWWTNSATWDHKDSCNDYINRCKDLQSSSHPFYLGKKPGDRFGPVSSSFAMKYLVEATDLTKDCLAVYINTDGTLNKEEALSLMAPSQRITSETLVSFSDQSFVSSESVKDSDDEDNEISGLTYLKLNTFNATGLKSLKGTRQKSIKSDSEINQYPPRSGANDDSGWCLISDLDRSKHRGKANDSIEDDKNSDYIAEASTKIERPFSYQNLSTWNNSNSPCNWKQSKNIEAEDLFVASAPTKGLLICFPITLGKQINSQQRKALSEYIDIEYFNGLIGSRHQKKQALFFIGKHEFYCRNEDTFPYCNPSNLRKLSDKKSIDLLYLDPHLVQLSATDATISWDTFHHPKIYKTPLSSLDPGILITFYCHTVNDLHHLGQRISSIAETYGYRAPLMVQKNQKHEKSYTRRCDVPVAGHRPTSNHVLVHLDHQYLTNAIHEHHSEKRESSPARTACCW